MKPTPLSFDNPVFTDMECAGLLPFLISTSSPLKVAEQLQVSYAHGGGWNPMPKFVFDKERKLLTYPGDPAIYVVSEAKCGDEELYLCQYAWLVIVQPDGSYEVGRVD